MTLFGRLDVLFPDGQRESHQLRGHQITVGRDHSCSIQLANDSIANFHLRLLADEKGVTITDLQSSTGALVDGKRLPADTPQPLRDTAIIAVGPLQLTFYKRSDNPTIVMPPLGQKTQPLLTGFRANLEAARYTVFPASSVTIPLSITNSSDADAEFRVEISGLPEDWVKPARLTFPLPADEATQLQFLVKPARRPDIPPQPFPFEATVTRLDESPAQLRLNGVIELGGYGGLSLAIEPALCHDKRSFTLFLLNQGNQALNLSLACHDRQSKLDVRLSQSALTLPPAGRAQVAGVVQSRRRPLIGKSQILPFFVTVKAGNPAEYAVPLPASVYIKPRLSRQSAALLAAIALIIAAFIALLAYQPPQPAIIRFALSESQVAQGTPVQLSWNAEHAQRFVIEVDRIPIADLPANASTHSLDTRDYSDPIHIALIARHNNATAIESRHLDVYAPVTVTHFYADRTTMLRNVIGTLTVRWEIEGAVSLDLSRPLGFETVTEARTAESRGELVLRGAPLSEFEILLSAKDELGNTTQQTIQISARDPECSPRSDAVIYAGPDARYAQLSIAVENVPVLVLGANETRDWLQVELASGQIGWSSLRSFVCQGFAPASLTVITDMPPLPTTTSTPAPTNTPSQTPSPTIAITPSPLDSNA